MKTLEQAEDAFGVTLVEPDPIVLHGDNPTLAIAVSVDMDFERHILPAVLQRVREEVLKYVIQLSRIASVRLMTAPSAGSMREAVICIRTINCDIGAGYATFGIEPEQFRKSSVAVDAVAGDVPIPRPDAAAGVQREGKPLIAHAQGFLGVGPLRSIASGSRHSRNPPVRIEHGHEDVLVMTSLSGGSRERRVPWCRTAAG